VAEEAPIVEKEPESPAPEPEPVIEVRPIVEKGPAPEAPEATEEEAPTPVFKAEPEEEPTPVFKAEEKPSGPTCPSCFKGVSEEDASCPHCGHVIKAPPTKKKPSEKKDEAADDPSKKPVSIRKIIRRK